jgi:predicted GNAT family acetyltransferase
MSHVEVSRDTEESRYVALVDGEEAGFIDFFAGAGVVELIHTEVDEALRGKGVASALVRHALDDIRAHSMKVIPICQYEPTWIEHHPDYADLVVRLP